MDSVQLAAPKRLSFRNAELRLPVKSIKIKATDLMTLTGCPTFSGRRDFMKVNVNTTGDTFTLKY